MARKKPNKTDIGSAYARLVKSQRTGEPVEKVRKDGGIATKPFMEFIPKPESDVLKECLDWLHKNGFGAKRMNNGSGDFGGGFRTYGIIGAGDILAIQKGRFIEVECKKGSGGVQSKNQQKHQAWVERFDGEYYIVHDVSELEYYLKGEQYV